MSAGLPSPSSEDQELDVLEFIALDSDAEVTDTGDGGWTSPSAASRRYSSARSHHTLNQRIRAAVVLLALAGLIACVAAAIIWQEGGRPPAQMSSAQGPPPVVSKAALPAKLSSDSAALAAAQVAEAAAASWDLAALPRRCGKAAMQEKLPPADEVIKSASDAREHRAIKLPGGMVALLTSDAAADFAAAAVDVNAGSINDPKDFQGLAHFLEHMLFMGTKKYPEEDAYSKFIDENGGLNNAYTDEEHTNFYFKVPASVLPEALDRFAQFFAEPLLSSGSAAREVHAVDAEHQKNLKSDGWRLMQLELSSCSGHVDHFGTGNVKTLRNGSSETVAALHAFHKKHYVSGNLRLSVLGVEPLDKLETLVRDAFAGVRRGLELSDSTNNSQAPSAKGLCPNSQVYVVEPVGDLQELMLTWPTRELISPVAQRSGVEALLTAVLAGKHEGSLYADLKRRGFATNIGLDLQNSLADLSVLGLSISLTASGLHAVSEVVAVALGHVRLVVDTIEAYLQKPSDDGDNSSDKGFCSLWSDVLAIGALHFHFAEKQSESDFVSGVARSLQNLPPRDVLGSTVAFKLDSGVMESIARSLNPAAALPNVIVVARGFDGGDDLRGALQRHKEPIYGTSYLSGEIPDKLVAQWTGLQVPSSAGLPWNMSHLLPHRLKLQPKPQGDLAKRRAAPLEIGKSRQYRILYKPDAVYRNPLASLRCLAATTAAGFESVKAFIEARMLTSVLEDGLEVPLNDASLAGYSWSVSADFMGLSLKVWGYSGKGLEAVARRVMSALAHPPELAPGRFEALKEAERRSICSQRNKPLYYVIAKNLAPLAFDEPHWSWDEQLSALDEVTWNATMERARAISAAAAVSCLAHGDISEAAATDLAETVADAMAAKPRAVDLVPLPGPVAIPPVKDMIEFRSPPLVPGDENAAVIFTYQLEPPRAAKMADREELKQAAAMLLLSRIGSQRAFDQLRTKEALGYVVALWTQPTNVVGAPNDTLWVMKLLVQSGVKSATYLRDRMAAFLDALLEAFGVSNAHKTLSLRRLAANKLEAVTDAEVKMAKQGLITELLKRPDTLADEGARIWDEIATRRFLYSRPWDVAEVVQDVKLKDIAEVLHALLQPGSAARKAAVEVWSSRDGEPLKDSRAMSLSDIKAVRRWKDQAGNWTRLLSSGGAQ